MFGGLVYTVKSDAIIENCFNTVSITSNEGTDHPSGLVNTNTSTLKITNCYNIGESYTTMWRGSVYKVMSAGLIGSNSGTVNLNKCYYLKTEKIVQAVTGADDDTALVIALNNKSEITADILNANASQIEHEEEWMQWIQGEEYPILDFSGIEGYPKAE